MASVNKCIIIGRLGSDPDLRQAQNGTPIANLSIATSERWTDKQTGEQKEQTEWHKVVLYNRLVQIAGGYLRKGSQVYIEGSLRTHKWQDQNGQDRYTTEIKAHSMQMLGSRQDGQQAQNGYGNPAPQGNYPQNGYGQAPHPQYGYGQPSPTTAMQRPPQGGYTPPSPPMPQNGGYTPQGCGVADDDMPF